MEAAEFARMAFLIAVFGSMCLILLDRKYSLKKTLTTFGSIMIAVIVLNALIIVLFGWQAYTYCYVFVTNGLLMTGLFFLSKRKGFPVLFNMLTATVFGNITAVVSAYIKLETGMSTWAEIFTRLMISIPLIIILYRYLRPSYLIMITEMKRGWGFLCLIPGIYYLINIINSIDLSPEPAEYRMTFFGWFLALLIVIVSYGVIFTLFARIIHEGQLRDEQQLIKLQMQAMERQVDMLKENEEMVSTYRHGLRLYIAEIKALIESGNTEDALRVLGSFDEQTRNTSLPYYCSNPTINAILIYYIQKAEHEGIIVETDCRLPKNLPVEASELAMVLANAIENAIHACQKLQAGRKRLIRIKIISSPQLALEVSNSYAGTVLFDDNGLPISTEAGHGLGTKSIAAFAEKYDGVIEYSTDDSLLRLRLLAGL